MAEYEYESDDTGTYITEEKVPIKELKSSKNIAELLSKEKLSTIGSQVISGYKIDEESRAEWKSTIDKAMKIYEQTIERKNDPWEGASNVKYPLIAEASIAYASRTLPEVIQNDRVVKTIIVGEDPDGQKVERGERVSKYQSYQLLIESPDWEDGLDQSLQMLPVLGTVFKKTYYSPIEERVISQLCVPDKIVVNYATPSLDVARRITHVITLYENDIIERQRSGIFCADIDIATFKPSTVGTDDNDYPIDLLEQHCWYDLDGDGYKEPYIVTVHETTNTVLRIVNRFEDIEYTAEGEVKRIVADQYFTDYHFIRSADGGFYSLGFGALLYPLNAAINTLINQLVDAGTLANTQGGFLGRGLRIKNGEFSIKMGEWKVLDAASGTDISKNIVPIPVREPSDTLFKLLSLLMQVGKDMSSTTDVLKGQQPAQNVASGTISTLVEQGTKVFTAINKRVYRALQKEFRKIYKLNYKYLKNAHYREVLQDPNADVKKDFDLKSLDIYPVADPTMSSDSQRYAKASVLQQLRTVDPRGADYYMMKDVMHLEDSQIKYLQPQPDPNAPPPPEVLKIQAQIRQMDADVAAKSAEMTLMSQMNQVKFAEIQQGMKESEARIQESLARIVKAAKDAAINEAKIAITNNKMHSQETLKHAEFNLKVDQAGVDTMISAEELRQNAKKLEAEVRNTKEEAKKNDN